MKTADEISTAINSIMKENQTAAGARQQFIAAESSSVNTSQQKEKNEESQSNETEIVCEGDVCYRKEKKSEEDEVASGSNETVASNAPTTPEETEEQRQEKIKHAMKLIEEKRIARIQEEERLEKEREIQRRKEGQELQKLKKWQDEEELKNLQDERKREKMEAKAARQRVLDQIEQDKKERAQRFQTQISADQSTSEQPKKAPPPAPMATPPNSTKIQFKLPNGDSEIVTFESAMLFADVHAYVKSDILQGSGIKDFTLATTFPRREFSSADFDKTLIDLNLVPSSVILVIPCKAKATSNTFNPSTVLPTQTDGNFFDMISALIMGLFSPVFALFAYVGRLISGNRDENDVENDTTENDAGKRKRNEDVLTPNDAAKRRNLSAYYQQPSTSQNEEPSSSKAYKRANQANIHRLHQDSESDDEDRKTWNGNSTQQL